MFAAQGSVFALIATAVVVVYWVLYRRAVPRPVALPPKYLTHDPGGLPPAMVGALFDPGMTPDKLAATLLDLVRRGVIAMKEPPGVDVATHGLDGDHLLRLHRDRLEGLRPFERDFVYELFDHMAGGDEVTIGDLRHWWHAFPATAGVCEEIIAFRVYQAMVAEGLVDPRAGRRKGVLTFIGIACFWGIILAPLLGAWAALFFALGVVLIFWTQRVSGITREGAKMVARYDSFRRYLADYGRFQDRPADAVVLWEEYLPLAIVLGVAPTAERELWLGSGAFTPGSRMNEFPDEAQALEYLEFRRGHDLELPTVRIVRSSPPTLRFTGPTQTSATVTTSWGGIKLMARRRPARALLAISPFIIVPVLIVIADGLTR